MVKASKRQKPKKLEYKKPGRTGDEQKKMKRILWISGLFFLLVIFRLFQLQVILGGTFREESLAMREEEMVVTAERGNIFDTNGEELAIDTSVLSLWIDPTYLRSNLENDDLNKDEVAAEIAEALGYEPAYVLRKLELNSGFVWLKKNVSFEEVESIKQLEITGLYFKEEDSRYYPDRTLGGNLLGFVNKTGDGVAGIEATYNELLQGQDGLMKGETDGHGNYIADTVKVVKESVPGKSIILTIDQKAQYIAQREIEKIRTELEPRSAVIMVMETKTGAIVASANTNTYDPNNYKDLNSTLFTTLEYQSVFEPGSTMKTIMAAAALNEGVVDENSTFYGNGYRKIGTETVKCSIYPRSHGTETMTEGFANSCNPVFVDIALLLKEKNKDAWFNYLDAFGFGKKSAISFGGESNGIMPGGTGDIYHATSAIGQGIAVTPIQILSAVSAVANDGQKMKPYLIKEVLDNKGNTLETYEPTIEGQLVSKEAAEKVQEMMKAVVDTGIGQSFQLSNNIESMGKTGNAQLVDSTGLYSKAQYVLSYIGVAPYNDPKYTVMVLIDCKGISSSIVAPYYKAVMEDIMALYSISNKANQAAGNGLVLVPELKGLRVEEAVRLCATMGLAVTADGTGYVMGQNLPAYSAVPLGTQIVVSAEDKPLGANQTIVPNLVGLRLPEAILLAENAGLKLTAGGSGRILAQSLAPGETAEKNSIVIVTLGE